MSTDAAILPAVILVLATPADHERGPLYMDSVLAAAHQSNPSRHPSAFLCCRRAGAVTVACRVPDEYAAIAEGQFYAQYPDCRLERCADEEFDPPHSARVWHCDVTLRHDLFPHKRYAQFEDSLNRSLSDPITSLLMTTSAARSPLTTRIEVAFRPVSAARRRRAERCLRRVAGPFFRGHHWLSHLYVDWALSAWRVVRALGWMLGHVGGRHEGFGRGDPLRTSTSRLHEREEDIQAAANKLGHHLFEAHIRLAVFGPVEATQEARAKLREMAGAFGHLSVPGLATFHASHRRAHRRLPWRLRGRRFLLSTEELATLCHPPTASARLPTLVTIDSREFEPPVTLPTGTTAKPAAVLGIATFRGRHQTFGILADDRRRHVAVLGKTGMGKSTLLHQLLSHDIQSGHGVALVDPYGDLAEAVLGSVPRSRTGDVILFDAADAHHPIGFNPLACPSATHRPLVASGVVSAFKMLYHDSWGPRLEYILRNAVLALTELPGATLLSILRLVGEAPYRLDVARQLSDPVVRAFWEREFPSLPPRLQAEAVAPIQNKVGQFVTLPVIRNIVGQPRDALDLRAVMDSGKILIMNLSKGRIGDDASQLLGALLVTRLQLAAMARTDVPESDRRDFHLYVDEFQNFATESFASTLSEARKYHLTLTVANQYLDQVDDRTRAALFGNVGTLLSFQVGPADAEILVPQFGGGMTEQDLVRLPRYHAYARLLVDGQPSRPFSMRTLSPTSVRVDPGRASVIRRYSRQRYARPVKDVERAIARAVQS